MFEDTNQTLKEELPEELFSEHEEDLPPVDGTPTETGEATDDANASGDGESGEGNGTPTETEQMITVTYNGEKKTLPLSEITALAQKGMNYDHIAEQRSQLQGELSILDDYARSSGMTREDYVKYLQDGLQRFQTERELQSLRERFPDADDDVLEEFADKSVRLRARDDEAKVRDQKNREDQDRRAPWERFFREHPDVDPKDIDKAFYAAVDSGKSPTEVFLERKISELTEKKKMAEKKQDNISRSVGSVAGDGDGGKRDPFLEGFNS